MTDEPICKPPLYNPYRDTWHAAERKMTAIQEEEYGQLIQFTPMCRDTNRRSVPDKRRQGFSFCGMFDWMWSDAQLGQRDMEVAMRLPWIFADRNKLPTMPANSDRFTLETQGRLVIFEVNEVRRDGVSGVIFILNEIGTEF
jgi:hypothetical protein